MIIRKQAVFFAFPICLFYGCSKTPYIALSTTTAVGIYDGHYDNGLTEEFTIKADGTYIQVLSGKEGVIYTNHGHWTIDVNDKYDNQVKFNDIILAEDIWNDNDGKPHEQDIYRAHWSPYGPLIVFAEKGHFWVEKIEPTRQP